ncbi:MAG TPA: GerMN domain-containing protein [Acidimicrobiia bacterium]|nr:GerMN domain-containing protein [Acidimicrobiia bacterium]
MTRAIWKYLATALLLVVGCGTGGEPSNTNGPSSTSPPVLTTTTTPGQSVDVFFGVDGSVDCAEVQAFPRQILSDLDPIQGAFESLLAGPTQAESGATSWFSADTSDALRSVTLADGLLTVDLDDLSSVISGASSSCGSAALLAQLTATGFQFPEVQEIEFQFEGSCDDFFNFLQMECTVIGRPG